MFSVILMLSPIKYFDVNIEHWLMAYACTIYWPCNRKAGRTLCFFKIYRLKSQVFSPCVCTLDLCISVVPRLFFEIRDQSLADP